MHQLTLFPSETPTVSPPLKWVNFYEPPDVDLAHDQWKAGCGPCAFAALLESPVNDAKRHFAGIDQRTYVNPTQMQAALRSAGVGFRVLSDRPGWIPARLVLVQFTGPWCRPEVPPQVAYRYTHWIAMRCTAGGVAWVYDVNVGFWISEHDWAQQMAPELVQSVRRADGWKLRLQIAVEAPSTKHREVNRAQ